MNTQKIIPLSAVLLTVILVGLIALTSFYKMQVTPQTDTLTILTPSGNKHIFEVELALTPKQQQLGLMRRAEMGAKHGMLFIFPKEERQAFWMKNTHIPLDILYINTAGKIEQIYKMTTPFSTKALPSKNPIIAALEINGGLTDKLNIPTGSTIKYPLLKK